MDRCEDVRLVCDECGEAARVLESGGEFYVYGICFGSGREGACQTARTGSAEEAIQAWGRLHAPPEDEDMPALRWDKAVNDGA